VTSSAGLTIAAKKDALDAARPLPAEIVKALADWFELELIYAGLAFEGLHLSRETVAEVLAGDATAARRLSLDEFETVRRLQKANLLVGACSYPGAGKPGEQTVVALHRALRLGVSPGAGQYRTGLINPADPSGEQELARATILPHVSRLPMLMKGLGEWLQGGEPGVDLALEAHYRLVRIMPFADANQAVGRLLMNLLLGRAGYPPIIVYPEHQDDYHEALEAALLHNDKSRWRAFMTGLLDQSLDACLVAAARGLVDDAAGSAPAGR